MGEQVARDGDDEIGDAAESGGVGEEELDFIINYDIKYRIGQENGDEGGEGEE